MREFRSRIEARSYELDSFGHVNHAVVLSYLEHARFEALAAGGFSASEMEARSWSVHVVRVEVDYLREIRMGDVLEIVTRVGAIGRTSMTIEQSIVKAASDEEAAKAKIVAVWIGPDRRPMRVPDEAIQALT